MTQNIQTESKRTQSYDTFSDFLRGYCIANSQGFFAANNYQPPPRLSVSLLSSPRVHGVIKVAPVVGTGGNDVRRSYKSIYTHRVFPSFPNQKTRRLSNVGDEWRLIPSLGVRHPATRRPRPASRATKTRAAGTALEGYLLSYFHSDTLRAHYLNTVIQLYHCRRPARVTYDVFAVRLLCFFFFPLSFPFLNVVTDGRRARTNVTINIRAGISMHFAPPPPPQCLFLYCHKFVSRQCKNVFCVWGRFLVFRSFF